jgi:hypothetical protein
VNYQEALELINGFMLKSGIHEHCTAVCKGKCCGGCYEQHKFSCRNQEGDTGRLTCTTFVCEDLERAMKQADFNDYSFVKVTVLRTIRSCWRNVRDVFHYPPTKKAIDEFQIEDRFVDRLREALSDENADKIRGVLNVA